MRLRTIGLILIVTLGILAAPLSADAQQARKVYRIGFLGPDSAAARETLIDAFRQGLRDLGYVEGKNITIEYRWAEGKAERLPDLAAELVRVEVDVIVAAGGTPSILAAKNATGMMPIVFPTVGDPVAQGLVVSLARPGGNITGLSIMSPELTAKQVELLKEVVPGARRIAVLTNPANPAHAPVLREMEVVARSLGVELRALWVRDPNEFDRAFSDMTRERTEALMVSADTMFQGQGARLANLVAKNRLPTIFPFREHVEAGGLMFYGVNIADLYRRAASYVDKILKGAKPADLPVEQPTRFELVINLKTAKALGLTIPQSILIRADKMIE